MNPSLGGDTRTDWMYTQACSTCKKCFCLPQTGPLSAKKLEAKQSPWSRNLSSVLPPAPLIYYLQKYASLLPFYNRKFISVVLEFAMRRFRASSFLFFLLVTKSDWKRQFLSANPAPVAPSLPFYNAGLPSLLLQWPHTCTNLGKCVHFGDYYQTKEALAMQYEMFFMTKSWHQVPLCIIIQKSFWCYTHCYERKSKSNFRLIWKIFLIYTPFMNVCDINVKKQL